MNLSCQCESFYLECIRNLLTGFKIENIDEFMSKLTPENCLLLSTAYTEKVLELIEKDKARVRKEKAVKAAFTKMKAMTKCTICNGTGLIMLKLGDATIAGDPDAPYLTCDVCCGSGLVSQEKLVEEASADDVDDVCMMFSIE